MLRVTRDSIMTCDTLREGIVVLEISEEFFLGRTGLMKI